MSSNFEIESSGVARDKASLRDKLRDKCNKHENQYCYFLIIIFLLQKW